MSALPSLTDTAVAPAAICYRCCEAEHEDRIECPLLTSPWFPASVSLTCSRCCAKFIVGQDVIVSVSEHFRPSHTTKWMHVRCAFQTLFDLRAVSSAAVDRAEALHRSMVTGLHDSQARTQHPPSSTETTPLQDEHPAVVAYISSAPCGTRTAISAGAGSGKTTLCEKSFMANSKRPDGTRSNRLCVSSTRSGVAALRAKPGIPDKCCATLHSIGLTALTHEFRRTNHGWNDSDDTPGATDLCLRPTSVMRHATKHVIMLQVLCPPTQLDGDSLVSLEFMANRVFVTELAEKVLLFGFGAPGFPDYGDQREMYEIVERYRLQIRLEQTIAALDEELNQRYIRMCPSPDNRLQTAMSITTQLLHEAVIVSTQRTWCGRQQWVNALNPRVCHSPHGFPQPSPYAVVTPILPLAGHSHVPRRDVCGDACASGPPRHQSIRLPRGGRQRARPTLC